MLKKTIGRTIRDSMGRFLAILAIIALGVGFITGLRGTEPAMIATADRYLDELNLYDFYLVTTLGLTEEDADAFREIEGIEGAYGSVSADMIFTALDGSDNVFHAHSIHEGVNGLDVIQGRLPQKANECVLDSFYGGEEWLGRQVVLSPNNSEDTFDTFAYDSYEVVGIVNASYYINFQRGTTPLAGGTAAGFIYLLPEGFSVDYCTEIFLTVDADGAIYSDEYEDSIAAYTDELERLLEQRAELRYESIYEEAAAEIADGQAELDENVQKLEDAKSDLEKGRRDYRRQRASAEKQLNEANEQLVQARSELDSGWTSLEAAKNHPSAAIPEIAAQIAAQEAALNYAEGMYEQNLAAYNSARKEAYSGFASAEKKLNDGQAEIDDAQKEIDDAQKEIDDAWAELEKLERPTCYVLDRNSNFGYASYNNDTAIVSGVAKVFPVFFFLVAALVCITTMTRMVGEMRTHNGILKALGYSNAAVASQYLVYAGSASVLGGFIGFFLGSKFMPMVMWQVYKIMYDIERPIEFVLDWKLFAVCGLLYLFGVLGVTWLVCRRDLSECAAELMRIKAPPAGKRVFLERIGFLWRRMSFLLKVTTRNILRYKKRMLMMIVGIGGCMALLLTGFGIRDTIQPILGRQYEEIDLYDASVRFLDNPDSRQKLEFIEECEEFASDVALLHSGNVDATLGDETLSIGMVAYNVAPEGFINLHEGKQSIAWPKLGEAVVNYRLAQDYGVQVGDVITVRDSDLRSLSVTVSGIYDNYIGDYMYVDMQTCIQAWGDAPAINTAYMVFGENIDHHEAGAALLNMDNVASVSINEDFRRTVDSMLGSLDYIVLVVLLCAGALAFIVLYNLTNITITERTREIATLKVLGFYAREQRAYVFRENLILTALGCLCGIPFGLMLLQYTMAQIKISNFYFGCSLAPISYLYAILITFAFTVIVNFAMRSKTGRI
ncbi:MAG: FtsX-like permease family protein, partial [Ruminococcaceae bacterium]|nr:FtsX-like permease family protein [Oscillospiraceae bacterium]